MGGVPTRPAPRLTDDQIQWQKDYYKALAELDSDPAVRKEQLEIGGLTMTSGFMRFDQEDKE